MGRFFQASDSKYVDDFIYTPPWELIAGITDKQDKNVQEQLVRSYFLIKKYL